LIKYILLLISIFFTAFGFSQSSEYLNLINWQNKDLAKDGVYGISLDKCYEKLIKSKKPKKKVIVAVLDSGIDIENEELREFLWINEKEVADNGKDDDNNGYIDDIHGWNFLGNEKGENINYENYEYVRLYKKLSNQFDERAKGKITGSEKKDFKKYKQVKKYFLKELNYRKEEREQLDAIKQNLLYSFQTFEDQVDINDFKLIDLQNLNTKSEREMRVKEFLVNLFRRGFSIEDFNELDKRNNDFIERHLNLNFNPRQDIINDDITSIAKINYGNNNVEGPRASHGTSVAGLIAAKRNNSYGIDGVTNHVELMVLRVVPNGDEYDKDVALAIRYAVDNGAEIINMSFGKSFSPEKGLVDDAIAYAEKKNVLLIHASGNETKNLDKENNFPTRKINKGKTANNWIEVAANSDKELVASFTNYGKKSVDVFAPGDKIVCLDVDDNFEISSGTSLAAPIVTGLAALLKAYYPKLTAKDLKEIILTSAINYKKEVVGLPNRDTESTNSIKFKKLSKTASVVNAYAAFKMAKNYRRR